MGMPGGYTTQKPSDSDEVHEWSDVWRAALSVPPWALCTSTEVDGEGNRVHGAGICGLGDGGGDLSRHPDHGGAFEGQPEGGSQAAEQVRAAALRRRRSRLAARRLRDRSAL